MDMNILAVVIGGWIGISVMVTFLVVAVSRAAAKAAPKLSGGRGYYLVPASAMVPAGSPLPTQAAVGSPDRYARSSAARSSQTLSATTSPCTLGPGTYRGATMADVKSGRARIINGHPPKLSQR